MRQAFDGAPAGAAARDRRLQSIGNVGFSSGEYSNFQFTTRVDGSIASIAESSDVAPIYPAARRQIATYNNLNEFLRTQNQSMMYDANRNLLSDGERVYTWDAEGQLIGITFPGSTGKQTAFAYDGADRRTSIIDTPGGGGSAVAASYQWCGARICQTRNEANVVVRGYFDEGEFRSWNTWRWFVLRYRPSRNDAAGIRDNWQRSDTGFRSLWLASPGNGANDRCSLRSNDRLPQWHAIPDALSSLPSDACSRAVSRTG